MKLGSKFVLPKFLTEPVKLTDASKLSRTAIDCFSKPISIDPDRFLDLLRRPISPRTFLVIPVALWLTWSYMIDLIGKRMPGLLYYNSGFLEPLVTIAAAFCILAFIAPFIPPNKVTVELGLSRPTKLEDSE